MLQNFKSILVNIVHGRVKQESHYQYVFIWNLESFGKFKNNILKFDRPKPSSFF